MKNRPSLSVITKELFLKTIYFTYLLFFPIKTLITSPVIKTLFEFLTKSLFSNDRDQARSRAAHCRGPCRGDLPAEIPQGALEDLGPEPPRRGHVGLF